MFTVAQLQALTPAEQLELFQVASCAIYKKLLFNRLKSLEESLLRLSEDENAERFMQQYLRLRIAADEYRNHLKALDALQQAVSHLTQES